MRETFERHVVEKFVRTYETGRTPNPCIDCNRHLKFGALLSYAREHDCDFIATGHYGRIGTLAEGGGGAARRGKEQELVDRITARTGTSNAVHTLSCALDPSKDQSYVLYSLTQERLARTLLPLGGLFKERDVRRIAREQGFENAGKRDSQGICFVPDNDFATYIEKRNGAPLPGGRYREHERSRAGTPSRGDSLHRGPAQRAGRGLRTSRLRDGHRRRGEHGHSGRSSRPHGERPRGR